MHQIGRKMKDLEAEIGSLEKDLAMVIDLLVTATHVETQVKIALALAQAEETKQTERVLWKELVESFTAFGAAWLALQDHYRSWIELRSGHRSLAAGIPSETRGSWDMAWAPAVRIPINAKAAFSLLWSMCVARGHFATPPVPEFVELAPDLSHFLTTLEIPGDVEKHSD